MNSRFNKKVFPAMVLTGIIVFFAGLLSSCSKSSQGDLLDSVPHNAKIIAAVNLDMILKNAGCKFNNGTITLSDDLAALRDRYCQDRADAVNMVLLTASTLDLKRVILYRLDNLDPVITFKIKNKEIFTALATGAAGGMESVGHFSVFNLDGCVIMTSDDIGWISTSTSNIEQSMARKGKKRHQVFDNIVSFINASNQAIAMAVNLHTAIDAAPRNGIVQGFENTWITGEATLSDNILGLEFKAVNNEGEALDVSPYIGEVSPDFLRYTPDNTQFLTAFGNIAGMNELYSVIRTALSPELRETIDPLVPYINEIDGTTSIAINPVATGDNLSQFSFDTWDVTFMTHLPQRSVDALNSIINHLSTPNTATDDQSVMIGNQEVFYGNYDGYFAASTRPISSDYNNSFAMATQGSRAMIVVDIPYNSETMKAFDLPYGVYLSIKLESSALKGKMKFNGSNSPFLAALASAAAYYARANPLPDLVTETVTDEYHDDSMIEDELQPVK